MSETHARHLRELHRELCQRYVKNGAEIENIWRSLSHDQRTKCLCEALRNRRKLKNASDMSCGTAYLISPEINFEDITKPGSDYLLQILRYRVTKTLLEQYRTGQDNNLGDLAFIQERMRTNDLRVEKNLTDCYSLFFDEKTYGNLYTVQKDNSTFFAQYSVDISAGRIVPGGTGELVVLRQSSIIWTLNNLIEVIIPPSSILNSKNLAEIQPLFKAFLCEAKQLSVECKDYLHVLASQPVVLVHAVRSWFFSHPSQVPDSPGRVLPPLPSRQIPGALFEAIHYAVKKTAIWTYITRLATILCDFVPREGEHKDIILQEIVNVVIIEYRYEQALLKRHVQSGVGLEWFQRVPNVEGEFGDDRVVPCKYWSNIEVNLERTNPQLYYLMRLCSPDTKLDGAIDCLNEIRKLYARVPAIRADLRKEEAEVFPDVVKVVDCASHISQWWKQAPFSPTRGQIFIAKLVDLEKEMYNLKKDTDLSDSLKEWIVPIRKLLLPGKASSALEILAEIVRKKAGTKMGYLYQDLVDRSIADLENVLKLPLGCQSSPKTSQPPHDVMVQLRQNKDKTRPPGLSEYDFLLPETTKGLAVTAVPTTASHTFVVGAQAKEVFDSIFGNIPYRPIHWNAFRSALCDIGFDKFTHVCTVFNFYSGNNCTTGILTHLPCQGWIDHKSQIILAQKIRRALGLCKVSFTALPVCGEQT